MKRLAVLVAIFVYATGANLAGIGIALAGDPPIRTAGIVSPGLELREKAYPGEYIFFPLSYAGHSYTTSDPKLPVSVVSAPKGWGVNTGYVPRIGSLRSPLVAPVRGVL